MLRDDIKLEDIIDEFIESESEDFFGKYCICGDLLTNHTAGKCYSLHFDGAKFSACWCKNKMPVKFQIEFNV